MTTIQVCVTMTQTLNNGDSIVSVDTIESNNQVSPEADADEHTSHEWLKQYITGRFNEVITLRIWDAARSLEHGQRGWCATRLTDMKDVVE